MKLSINLKLAAIVLSMLLIQSVVVIWINYSVSKNDLVETTKSKYRISSNSLQQYLSYLGQNNQVIQMQETIAALGADTDLDAAYLVDDTNRVIAATSLSDVNKTLNKIIDEAYYKSILANLADVRFRLKSRVWISDDEKKMYIAAPVPLGKTSSDVLRINRVGAIIKQVNLETIKGHVFKNLVKETFPFLMILTFIVLATYGLLHYLITSRITRLQEYAATISLDQEIEKHNDPVKDEIGLLVDSFNAMLAEIKSTYDKIKHSQEMLKISQSIGKLGSWELDLKDNEVIWSDETYQIFGYDRELESATLDRVLHAIHPDDRERVERTYFQSVERNKDSYEEEHRIINQKTGDLRYVYEKCIHKRDDSGRIISSTGMVHDITSLKLHEKQIISEKEKHKTLLDAMIDAVISINEKGQILTFNPAAEKMFGYMSYEVIGENVAILTGNHSAEEHDHFIQNYITTGIRKIIGTGREVEARTKSGESLFVRLTISEFKASETGERRFIGVCHDMTKEKLQEEQIRQSQKMDAMGQLTGGIAHDFNNSLGVILGYAEMLRNKFGDSSKEYQYISQILTAGERARKLTSKLLSFSRKRDDESNRVNMNELLEGSYDMLTKTLTPKINISYGLTSRPCVVNIDRSSLEDAILNISINAMHAMPDGGKLSFTTSIINITEKNRGGMVKEPGKYVMLCIKDTGFGMDEETRQRVFEPFFSTKGSAGTGLGMSQVYGFVKNAGGYISVESKPGQGTEIEMILPCAGDNDLNHEDHTDKSAITDESGGSEQILIVDDEEALAEMSRSFLCENGYHAEAVTSGEEALQRLSTSKYDLLISDILMPGMDGYELIEKALALQPALKVLIVSGYDDREGRKQFGESGTLQRLEKPFTIVEMLTQVRELLNYNNKTG